MNEIWANRLIAGTKAWDEMPPVRRKAVKVVLSVRVATNKITEEQYKAITGETYQA